MSKVYLPEYFTTKYQTPELIEIESDTIKELLSNLISSFPKLETFMYADGKELRKFVNIFVDNNDIRDQDGLETKIDRLSEIVIVLAVAGG